MIEYNVKFKDLKFELTEEDLKAIARIAVDGIKRRMYNNEVTPETEIRDGITLVDTGRLVRSIDYLITENMTIKVGTNIEYAKNHQEGIGTKKREFLLITPKILMDLKREIEKRCIK